MLMHSFSRPFSIAAGLGATQRIASVNDALAFLDGCPVVMHDEAYEAARECCRAALYGLEQTEDAQDTFTAFARRRGIYVDDGVIALEAAS